MALFDTTELSESSFRGVPFYTNSTELSSGHRLTDHKFINGGTKTEDNGLDNKTFKISAYIGGENYLNEKTNLINALDIIGTGTLVDMFYGTLTVEVETYSFKEDKRNLGQATVDITFKKAENEAIEEDLIVYNLDYTDNVYTNFANNFDTELGEEIMDDTALSITDVLQKVEDTVKFLEDSRDFVQGVKSKIGRTISTIKTTILSIDSLTSEIADIVTSFDDMLDLDTFGARDQASFTNGLSDIISTDNTSTNEIEAKVNKQTKAFTHCLCSLLVQTAIKNLENIEFDTGDESGTIKEDILNAFEYLTEDIETDLTDDIDKIVARKNLMDSYQEAKKTFIQYYTQKYSGLQNLTETKIIQTTDIFSLTMDKYTDITRVDEVIANNDIVDPLFIKGTLEILER